jgi:hypothetical protein
MKRSDEKRVAIFIIVALGQMGLICSMLFLGTLHWFGVPATATPLRLLIFGMLAFLLAISGHRLASGTWKSWPQVLHQSAAVAGLLFLAVCLRKELNVNRPPLPPGWVVVIAAFAPITWLLARSTRRHSRKQLRS